MSVIMTLKAGGDTDAYRKFVDEKNAVLAGISEEAKGKGCIHHSHGVGDGFVLIVDEWESAEAFQSFFASQEEIPKLMKEIGMGEPEISFAEKIDSPDAF